MRKNAKRTRLNPVRVATVHRRVEGVKRIRQIIEWARGARWGFTALVTMDDGAKREFIFTYFESDYRREDVKELRA